MPKITNKKMRQHETIAKQGKLDSSFLFSLIYCFEELIITVISFDIFRHIIQ